MCMYTFATSTVSDTKLLKNPNNNNNNNNARGEEEADSTSSLSDQQEGVSGVGISTTDTDGLDLDNVVAVVMVVVVFVVAIILIGGYLMCWRGGGAGDGGVYREHRSGSGGGVGADNFSDSCLPHSTSSNEVSDSFLKG